MFRKSKKTLVTSLLCGLCYTPLFAQENQPIQYHIAEPSLASPTYFLIDYHSGAVLAEKNADHRQAPASLTKMMTSYVIGQALKQGKIQNDDLVSVPAEAWGGNKDLRGSSLMFLRIGQKVSVADLNRGIIVDSGNDACITMAEYLSGSQNTFVQSMNRYAQEMGLKNTHFMTVHGLDQEGQYSSARDMAIIGKHLIHDLPNEYKLYAIKQFTFNGITQNNRNGLLWDTSLKVDGLKTGHTNEAGYNLVASALGDNNMRLISVVMGAPSKQAREQDSKKLLRWGFANFETVSAFAPNKPMLKADVYYGNHPQVALGVLKPTFITLPKGRRQEIKIRYELMQKTLKAPLAQGQVLGKAIYQLDGNDIASVNLQVLENVNEGSIFSRLWDWIRLQIQALF